MYNKCLLCASLGPVNISLSFWCASLTRMAFWHVPSGSPTRLVPLTDMRRSPMLSLPDFSATPLGMRLAMTTVGKMEPQPDSTTTTPRISPFCLQMTTCRKGDIGTLANGRPAGRGPSRSGAKDCRLRARVETPQEHQPLGSHRPLLTSSIISVIDDIFSPPILHGAQSWARGPASRCNLTTSESGKPAHFQAVVGCTHVGIYYV